MKNILPPERILTGERVLLDFARDSWPRALWWSAEELEAHKPLAVARPENATEVSSVLRHCCEQGIPVVPRGGGSGVCGAAIPAHSGSLVLDIRSLDSGPAISKIRVRGASLNAACAGAGIFGDVLEKRLNERGLTCGHFPASMSVSTLGGWVAANSSGQVSTAYGPFRERILSLSCVAPDGSLMSEEQVSEWVGSEGTLGVIAGVSFIVMPLETGRRFASYVFKDMPEALKALRLIAREGLKPAVARLYDGLDRRLLGPEKRDVSINGGLKNNLKVCLLRKGGLLRKLSEVPGIDLAFRPLLILVAEGADSSRKTMGDAGRLLASAGGVSLGEAPARKWWDTRYRLDFEKVEAMRRRGCFADTLDVFSPWESIEAVYRAILRASSPFGLAMAHASHITDEGACLYFTLLGSGGTEKGTIELYDECWKAMMEACARSGGRTGHHHGVGLAKLPWIETSVDRSWRRAHAERKRRLDPKGIMNPGKL